MGEERDISKTVYIYFFFLGSRLSSANTSYLMGNLEEICSFQQMLVQSLEECTK